MEWATTPGLLGSDVPHVQDPDSHSECGFFILEHNQIPLATPVNSGGEKNISLSADNLIVICHNLLRTLPKVMARDARQVKLTLWKATRAYEFVVLALSKLLGGRGEWPWRTS